MNMQTTTMPKADEAAFDPEQLRAEFRRIAELAASSPASQAACDLMRLVMCKSPALKTMPVSIRFQGAGPRSGDGNRWWASWSRNGQSFLLYLSMFGPFTSTKADGTTEVEIDGEGYLSLAVDGEQVMALRVELRCNDPEGRIAVVGAAEFEPGPWENIVIEQDQRLATAAAARITGKAA